MDNKTLNEKYAPSALKKDLNAFQKYYKENPGSVPPLSVPELAAMIDHTILKPEAVPSDIELLCNEALKYSFASVCVNSSYVEYCYALLKDSPVKVCTVVGFPLGAMAGSVKIKETEYAIQKGASEVDMVINIGRLKSGDYNYVFEDIRGVTEAAHNGKAICKVIIETCLLSDEEKAAASLICRDVGADFVKTSTGFSKAGADARDVALMKYFGGENMGVKASGGIRIVETAFIMIASGASRLGTSSGVKIVEDYKKVSPED